MATKGQLWVDDAAKLEQMQDKLISGGLEKFYEARDEISNLLEELTAADWRNHDSKRFIRHYKDGEKLLNETLKKLETCVMHHLSSAILDYQQLDEEVESYFSKGFWG